MKNKKQRIKLADSGVPSQTVQTQTESAPASSFLSLCPFYWYGCNGDCKAHPSAMQIASGEVKGPLHGVLLQARSDKKIFQAMLGNPELEPYFFKELIKFLPGSWETQARKSLVYEECFLLVLNSKRLNTKLFALLLEAPLYKLSEEVVLEVLEHPLANDKIVAQLIVHLRGDSYSQMLLKVILNFGTETQRVMVHLSGLGEFKTGLRLLKAARVLLARLNGSRDIGMELIQGLASEWTGTHQEFANMVTVLAK